MPVRAQLRCVLRTSLTCRVFSGGETYGFSGHRGQPIYGENARGDFIVFRAYSGRMLVSMRVRVEQFFDGFYVTSDPRFSVGQSDYQF